MPIFSEPPWLGMKQSLVWFMWIVTSCNNASQQGLRFWLPHGASHISRMLKGKGLESQDSINLICLTLPLGHFSILLLSFFLFRIYERALSDKRVAFFGSFRYKRSSSLYFPSEQPLTFLFPLSLFSFFSLLFAAFLCLSLSFTPRPVQHAGVCLVFYSRNQAFVPVLWPTAHLASKWVAIVIKQGRLYRWDTLYSWMRRVSSSKSLSFFIPLLHIVWHSNHQLQIRPQRTLLQTIETFKPICVSIATGNIIFLLAKRNPNELQHS